MEFIDFKSSKEIDKSRQDLREARDAMLEKAKAEAEYRAKRREKARERGEGTWMLPEVSEKIDKSAKKSKHKTKKHKKEKKKKRKKEKHRKSSSESDSEVEDKIKPPSDKIVDHSDDKQCNNTARDEWMTLSGSLGTFTRSELHRDRDRLKDEKKDSDVYAPGKNSRELNPYWKDGGDGLPSNKLNFRKPSDDAKADTDRFKYRQGNWRKKSELPNNENAKIKTQESEHSDSSGGSTSEEESAQPEQPEFLTDQQMNELAAKLVKAEILGNESLVIELKQKLEDARTLRKNRAQLVKNTQGQPKAEEESVVLTRTDSRGLSRPLADPKSQGDDPYYGRKRKNKKVKVDTHTDGKRTKYFADDDRHSLKDMFENERLSTTDDQNKEFADIVAKHTNPNDSLEDIFSEKIRSRPSDSKTDEKAKNRAVREHEKLSQALDDCNRCLDSKKMEKHLIVAMGEYVYLSLLPTEGLGKGHCCIVPMRHVSCSTLLDEEIWREIQDFKKALTRMFNSRSLDVVFFENAIYLNRRPHMVIQCVPGPSRQMELVPFYFKKAIQECEGEWSHNKKLIDLKGREVTKAIPKGLPYFWVDFGDNTGFAHVIEEQDRFPRYFAQEIIGGMLELEPRMWRHPKKQHLPIQKVTELAEWWKPFDITK